MRKLYPFIEPFDSGYLDVGQGHRLYYEQSGQPAGMPAVFLHGGPGGGSGANARRFFDPQRYRIVVFDQRGAGRSEPRASLEANTTAHLIDDIEVLRERLGIDRWLVFGGSWGSTLALSYAQAHPRRVSALVLRGIFLLRQREIDWFYQDGASRVFPDRWQDFLAPIPEHERGNLLRAYHRRLNDPNLDVQLEAARAWSVWEGATSALLPNDDLVSTFSADEFAIALARIETHYFVNGGFFASEHDLLRGIESIRHIPAVIVQGRYDIVCPMESAWELARAWPEAEFNIVPAAGHSAYEPDIASALIEATDAFARGDPS
ncbi:MAG: prolyl aminopeptidase [Gammaproteobacteria bacterium]